jgi:FkbH-like protein
LNLFEFPLNISNILRKKKSIKKNLLNNRKFIEKNIAILGGSTTSEIKYILELFLLNNGIQPSFYESGYNKYYEDAVFENEELKKFNPDIIYIHTTNKNILKFPDFNDDINDIKILLKNEINRYETIWNSLSAYDCAIIQNNFDYCHDRSLGNIDSYDIHGKTYFINKLNKAFSTRARELNNLYINDINYLSSYLGLKYWFDKSLWCQAKYALSMDSIPELAFNISKIINSILGKSKKCLVLDLDNTCWGGVIGDDGLEGIQIGTETAVSEAHTLFQKYVKELRDRGIIIAICSKNNYGTAKKGFDHPESILNFSDFSVFKANWNPKHNNIEEIAKEINIGIDSLVFIDDSPMEREIVSSQIPGVSVPDIGDDIATYIDHIDKNGYFEANLLSKDDLKRNRFYDDNKKRLDEKAKFQSYDDFLVSLEMIAEIKPFSPIYLDRITQLINKTNQFNLTTKRYTAGEIKRISLSEKHIKLYGKLFDKYGDNGLVAISIGEIKAKTCYINLWVMSCRVIKRNMEFAMFDEFVNACKHHNISEIIAYYYKSSKNEMVSNLYKDFGFTIVEQNNGNTIWKLDVSDYKNTNSIIEVKNG